MIRHSFFRTGIFLLLLCSALAIGACQSQAQAVSNLTVRVTGIRNANGKISLALFRDSVFVERRFVEIDANTLTAQTVFVNLPRGIYSVNVFHDENMNGKMDTNLFGMPVEGYGFSNNPAKRMGKPGFDETNFQLNPPEAAIEIKMIYW
jgi:uncharacterized protein (DUF2141 family)